MSEEKAELVRAIYAHIRATGEPPSDAFLPDAEFDASALMGLGVFKGRERVIATVHDYTAAFEEWSLEPGELLEAGDHVVVDVRDAGRLKETDTQVAHHFSEVWTFEGDKVRSWRTFTDRAEALRAAGVSE